MRGAVVALLMLAACGDDHPAGSVAAGGAAIDVGVAPNLGAYEAGAPLPIYGPR